jgi:undecaprenyl-diphosphatase
MTAPPIADLAIALAAAGGLFLLLWGLCLVPLAHLIQVLQAGGRRGAAWLLRSGVGRWFGAHPGPLGAYGPALLLLGAGGLSALATGNLFVELAEQLRLSTSATWRVDRAIHTWVGEGRRPALTLLLSAATWAGGPAGLTALVGLVAAVLLARRERTAARFLVVTSGAGALLNVGLKLFFGRARPDLALAIAEADGYSFPSGHAMGSFVTYGALAYLVLRRRGPWAGRSAGLALAITMVLMVGLSRVYLGVHWASDIAGGWSAGAVWLAAAVTTHELLALRGPR